MSARKRAGTARAKRAATAHAPEPEGHSTPPTDHADGGTTRPETPTLEGRVPLPEEITGRASGTDDNLVTLFESAAAEHLTDGFRGGSEETAEESGSTPEAGSIAQHKVTE